MADENVGVRETRDEMRGECNERAEEGGRGVCMYVRRGGGKEGACGDDMRENECGVRACC